HPAVDLLGGRRVRRRQPQPVLAHRGAGVHGRRPDGRHQAHRAAGGHLRLGLRPPLRPAHPAGDPAVHLPDRSADPVNRIAQGLVLVLLGAAALGSSAFSELYLNYVQAAFRPFLIAAGLVLVVLGALVVAADLRAAARGEDGEQGHDGHDHGHDHHGGPRVAWLLVLPVVAVFVVAPPALGAYTA